MSLDKQEVRDLERSRRTFLGELFPILEDADGDIIDGKHRSAAGWNSKVTLEQVDTPLKKAAARLIANRRRVMPFEERRELYDTIAEELIKEGKAQVTDTPLRKKAVKGPPNVILAIAELLGVSASAVSRYISNEYKSGVTVPRTPKSKIARTDFQKRRDRKRSVFEIRGEMLDILFQHGEIKPTNWMYDVNISWTALQEHADFLLEKELVYETETSSHAKRYRLTDKGEEILSYFRMLLLWLK